MSRLNCYRCDDRTVSAFPFVLIIFFVVSTVWPGGEVPSFAQEIDPEQLNRSMNWFHNAKHHHELGEDEKALVCLDKALEIYPGNPEANELLNFIKSGGQKPAVSPEGDGTAEEQTPKMKKACVINLKVLGGGLEMYDMDREGGESIPEGPVTAGSQLGETLLNEGYVKKVPVCPGGGTYIHRGNCSVYCTVHGEDDLVVTGDDLLPLLDGDLNGLAGPTPEAAEADPQSLSPKEALKKAGLLIREGQLSAALPFAQAANEGLDSSAVSLNVLGYIHEKLGVLDEAIRYYQKAMEKEPDNPAFANNFAFACASAGILLSKAVEKARLAVDLKPTSEHFRDTLGFCLLKMKNYDGAAKAFSKALELTPEFPQPTFHLSFIDTANGHVAVALEKLNRVITANPDYLPALTRTAVLKAETGDREMATKLFLSIMQREPEHSLTLFYLGFMLLDTKPEEAGKYFQAVTMINPESAESYLSRAFLAQQQGADYSDVVSHHRSAIEARPSWWLSSFTLAAYLLKSGDLEKALDETNVALRIAEPHLTPKIKALIQEIEKKQLTGAMNWYENAEWRYRFALPGSDWEVSEDTEFYNVDEAQVVLIKQDENTNRLALIAIIVQDNEELYTADDMISGWEAQIPDVVRGYHRLGVDTVEVGDYEGKALVFEQDPGISTKQAIISFGKTRLTVLVTDLTDYFEESVKVYEKVIKTFHFL